MRPSLSLLYSSSSSSRLALNLTLFTRSPCGLCDTAKHITKTVLESENKKKGHTDQTHQPISYREIDIIDPAHKNWRDCYEFDVPVLHVDKEMKMADKEQQQKQRKLFHRWTEEELLQAMREVEQGGMNE